MDAVIGALIAAAIGWTSILGAVALPIERWIPPDHVRRVGGLTLALVAASLFGATIPAALPLAFLGGGLLVALVVSKLERRPAETPA